jgi:hypothetical protein
VSYGKLDLLIRFTKEYNGYENSFDRKQLFAGRPKIYFKIAAARGEELYTKNLHIGGGSLERHHSNMLTDEPMTNDEMRIARECAQEISDAN